MNTFDIKAELKIQPTKIIKPKEVLQITRGGSAILNFSLEDKIYNFDNIDQITFMLKQDDTIYWYEMFTFIKPTNDLRVMPEKKYYTRVSRPANSFNCSATLIKPAASDCPIEMAYYEEIIGKYSRLDTEYLIDERFYYEGSGNSENISLILRPEDTIQLKAKTNKVLDFEIAVRLNANALSNAAYKDTVLIEPQPQIIVTDSLFSQI